MPRNQCPPMGASTKRCWVHTLSARNVTLCTKLLHFALSDPIVEHELSSEYKAVDCPRSNKIGVQRGTQCPLLCLSTRSFNGTAPKFEHKYLKILVLSNYHTGTLFPGTKSERCLSSIGSDLSVRNLHLA